MMLSELPTEPVYH